LAKEVARDRAEQESRRILERVGAETEARMATPRAEQQDWAEVWGKRIGRVLSFVLLGIAVVWLYDFLIEMG
jgi:hypothetical protein